MPASNGTGAKCRDCPQLAILVVGALNLPAAGQFTPDEVTELMNSLFERLRTRRLATIFALLGTLSVTVVAGSFLAHGVRGQEKQNASADATPLSVVNSSVSPNEFVKIAKQVGPAVVNINTETLPKQSENKGRKLPHGRTMPTPQNPGDDDQGDEQGQGQGNFQDFFNHFFGGQAPDQE